MVEEGASRTTKIMPSFQDFHAALTVSFPEDYARGRQFERACKWFLETDPRYVGRLEEVWLWDDWPGKWGRDCGIDLVARDRNGRIWAIQAKCYAPETTVTKSDVDKFLSESVHESIDCRLLITTTDRLAVNAGRVLRQQHKVLPVHKLMRTGLIASPVVWPPDPLKLHEGAARKPWKPKRHQELAIEAVRNNLKQRGQLIMACGTGKTLSALWIAEALAAKRTLVLLPSLTLLSQTVTEWLANAATSFPYLPVCSDETVTRSDDAATMFTSDMSFPVTTQSEEIATFLGRPGQLVVFSTYQSSPRVAKAMTLGEFPPFDLIVADEAHRCAGKVSSDYGTVLKDEELPAKKRLFMTATPRTFTDRVTKKAEEAGLTMASMDDESVFGPVLHHLSFGDAIENGLLTDYRVVICGVDDERVKEMVDVGRIVETETGLLVDARTLAGHIAMAKAIRTYSLHRTITFHSRVQKAKDFAATLPKVLEWMKPQHQLKGELLTSYVSGTMPTGQRNTKLNGLRQISGSQHGLLANAKCLSEGVDVPSLDGVAFIDPRRSQVDIVQAVGRAIRLSENKTLGTILIPVYLTGTNDPALALESSVFKPVWEIVQALRAHDESLGNALDEIRMEMGRTGKAPNRSIDDRLVFEFPERISGEFIDAFKIKMVEKTTSTFEFGLGVLQRFVERENHARVPQSHIELFNNNKHGLGAWVSQRRKAFFAGELSIERIAALDRLGFEWDPLEAKYQQRLTALKQFVVREGHTRVPEKHKELINGIEINLAAWILTRRRSREKGELSVERIAALDRLGFEWDPHEATFQQGLAALKQFVAREGHIVVFHSHIEWINGIKHRLGSWVIKCRAKYREGKLSAERIKALNQLNFEWDIREAEFQRGLAAFQQFVAREGHASVPDKHQEIIGGIGVKLKVWISGRRTAFTENRLLDEHTTALDRIGFEWDPHEAAFQQGLAALKQFVAREDHTCVPREHKELINGGKYELGSWLEGKRSHYRNGKLSTEHIKALDLLNVEPRTKREVRFQKNLAALEQFVAREGDAKVVRDHKEMVAGVEYNLGRWVSKRRAAYKKGRLTKDQIDKLTELGFCWDLNKESFIKGVESLKLYIRENGSSHVDIKYRDTNDFHLGSWMNHVRSDFRKGVLPDWQLSELNNLGMIWEPIKLGFRQGLESLLVFRNKNGHSLVPTNFEDETGFKLGEWLNRQRFDANCGKLSASKIAQLNELGTVWNHQEFRLDLNLLALEKYVKREGDAQVPQGHKEHVENIECTLGNWVNNVRNGKVDLSKEVKIKLNSLNFIWDVHYWKFQRGLDALKQFTSREGHCLVTRKHVEVFEGKDVALGSWVHNYRSFKKAGTLDVEKIKILDTLNFDWDPYETQFQNTLKALRVFIEREDNTKVPWEQIETINGQEINLGAWFHARRKAFEKGSLKQEHFLCFKELNVYWAK